MWDPVLPTAVPPSPAMPTRAANRDDSGENANLDRSAPKATVLKSQATPNPSGAGAIVNARIFLMGPPRDGKPGWEHTAEALLWKDGRIVAVGTTPTITNLAAEQRITPTDLQGRVVLPGFVDAHTHFLHVGVKGTRPDLRGTKSLKEALDRVTRFLIDHPGSHHVIAEGWDESEWTASPGASGTDGRARRPTKQDLDAVVAAAAKAEAGPLDRPLVLRRICGHVAVASSGALPAIQEHWPQPGAVHEETGLLLEAPSLYLNEVLASTPAELDRALVKACQVAHRLGVTTVGDYSQAPYRAALQRAAARGTLDVRISSSIYVQQLDEEVAAGFRTGQPALGPADLTPTARLRLEGHSEHFGPRPGRDGHAGTSPWLHDGGLKVFLDGSLGGHTAYLREPYLDLDAGPNDAHAGHDHAITSPNPHGARIWTPEDLDRFFGMAHGNGIQLHAHAIGDAAIDQGLDAFARLAAREGLEGRGWVVERLPRTPVERSPGSLGQATANPAMAGGPSNRSPASRLWPGSDPSEPSTIPEGVGPGESLRHRFEHYEIVHDDQLTRTAELGVVASSQPNFVGEWSAKGGMYEGRLGPRYRLNNRFRTIVGHQIPLAFGSDGMPFGPLVGLHAAVEHPDPEQRLSAPEAVWHYTTAAAWSLHWPSAGALLAGMHADFVILDQTNLQAPPKEWNIVQTYAAGLPRL